MAVIDLKRWAIAEQGRIKTRIRDGERNRRLTRRSLHLQHVLSEFARIEASNANLKIKHRSNLWKVSHLFSDVKPFIFPELK
jgi:hypothetical protein